MNFLLDTNIIIHFFRGKFGVTERFETANAKNCAISEITLTELFYGAENSTNPSKNHLLITQLIDLIPVLPI